MSTQRVSASAWHNAIPNAFSSDGQGVPTQPPGGNPGLGLPSETRQYATPETQGGTRTAQPSVDVQGNPTGWVQRPPAPTYAQQTTPQVGRESNVYASTTIDGRASGVRVASSLFGSSHEGSRVVSNATGEYQTAYQTQPPTLSNDATAKTQRTVTFQPDTQQPPPAPQSYVNGNSRSSLGVSQMSGETRTSMRVGEGRLVSERIGESRVVSERVGERRVIETHNLEGRVVEERTVQGASKVVSEVEGKRTRMSGRRDVHVQEVEVEYLKRDKVFEIVRERPVRVERFVDVPYDVVVDVPVERTIERERITNIVREVPVERVVEVPIEQVIEIPVEKIIEQAVEVRRFVEVPRERVVERPYDVVRENVTFQDRFVDIDERDLAKYPHLDRVATQVDYEERERVVEQPFYTENVVERIVPVERQRVVEVPRERVVENRRQVVVDRPQTVERVVTRDVEVPVERPVYKDMPVRVERPVYRENLIEVRVPVERVVEKEVRVTVDRVREQKVVIEQVIENPVEHIVEVPVAHEEVVEELVEQIVEEPFEITRAQLRPQEKIIRRSAVSVRQVQVPVPYPIDRLVARPVASPIERRVNRYSERRYETPLERPVYIERIIEVPRIVERVIEVPVEVVREEIRYVEKITERPIYIDTVIDKFVEVIVERVVEVPVEKVVEVEVVITIEVPVIEEVFLTEDVVVEGLTETFTEAPLEESRVDFQDELLAEQIKLRQLETDSLVRKNRELSGELARTQQEVDRLSAGLTGDDERENFALLSQFAELNSRYRMEVEHSRVLCHQRANPARAVEPIVQGSPLVDELRRRLESLVSRNQQLCEQVQSRSASHLKRVRLSQFRA